MARKKWFLLAAVAAAIGGAMAYVLTKVKENPEKAAEVYEGVKETANEPGAGSGPLRRGQGHAAARQRRQRGGRRREGDRGLLTAADTLLTGPQFRQHLIQKKSKRSLRANDRPDHR